jgi:heme o synthase
MAIAWIYRDDYARAGYFVLPADGQRDRFVTWQTLVPLLLLVPISLVPAIRGGLGPICIAGVIVLGAIFLGEGVRFLLRRSNLTARRLLTASIIYLPFLFLLWMLDKK